MTDTFSQAFAIVVGEEGGFTVNPADPGNWTGGACGAGTCRGTKYGIAASAHPGLDIAGLTLDAARAIYREQYWTPIGGDRLPPALALLAFDAAINNGPGRAIRWLQEALGVEVDGELGPHSWAALDAHAGHGAALCTEYLAQRIAFMGSLPTWRSFGLGWSRRLAGLPFKAMTMTMGAST